MPSIKYGNDLDLMTHELQNATLQNLATNPASPKRGAFYISTTDNLIHYYDGIAWMTLTNASALLEALDDKVDKVEGKQLSTEDFTTALLTKLNSVAEGAEVNVQPDWNASEGDAQILNKPTLGSAASRNVGTAEGQVPVLNASGKLPDTVIPPLALGEYAGEVSTKNDLTTLTNAQQGDIAKVTSDSTAANNGVYFLNGTATVLSNWIQIVGPGSVISVNGQSGVVTLTAADVGAVPTTRTVNGKSLSDNISLAASDVGAVPTTRTVNGKSLSDNIALTAADVDAVPPTRTVNGKDLSTNIVLTAADVGAVPANAAIEGGTFPVVTVDENGLVTAGRALQAADIPVLDASKIASGQFVLARLPTGNAAGMLPVLGGEAQNGQALAWDSSSQRFVPITLTTGNVNRFEASIEGDGAKTEFSFAHGLGRAGIVQVVDSDGAPFMVAFTIDATNVTVTFSTAPTASESYTVRVLG